MRVVINTKLADRNRSIATYLFIATFVLLIGGFIFINQSLFTGETSIDSVTLLLQVLILPIAFVLTIISIRMTNLWARRPRPEDVILEGLKGLSKKSVLYHYYHFPTRHLLISPQGVFAIVTRWHEGNYSVSNDVWRTKANPLSRTLSSLRMDGIGNPSLEAKRAAEHAQKLLAEYAPNMVVQPLVVFISPKAQVEVSEEGVSIAFADGKQKPSLKDFMRDVARSSDGTGRNKVNLPLTDEQLASFERKTVK